MFFPNIPQKEEAWKFLFKERVFQVMWIATCELKAIWPLSFAFLIDDFFKPQICGKPQWSLSSANLPIIISTANGQNGGMGEEGTGLKG